MRDRIRNAEKRDNERNWIVTGVAEIGEILRGQSQEITFSADNDTPGMKEFQSQINENLKCDDITSLNLLLTKLYDRMIELREEETDKKEKKIRREKDAKTILNILEINNDPKATTE